MNAARAALGACLAAWAWLAPGTSAALTQMPEEEMQYGRIFDTASPRSQRMQSILCFGRDPAACSKEPSRYYGMRFLCDWPHLYPERMTPDNLPERQRFFVPTTALMVGEAAAGQTCIFSVALSIATFALSAGTRDYDDLLAWVEWEFEQEVPPGLVGKREGERRIVLPYHIVPKRDGSSRKSPWDGRGDITINGITRPKNLGEYSALPERVKAKAQKSWVTLIINGQVIEKIEVEWKAEPLKWIEYDWRRKDGRVYQIRHGG